MGRDTLCTFMFSAARPTNVRESLQHTGHGAGQRLEAERCRDERVRAEAGAARGARGAAARCCWGREKIAHMRGSHGTSRDDGRKCPLTFGCRVGPLCPGSPSPPSFQGVASVSR